MSLAWVTTCGVEGDDVIELVNSDTTCDNADTFPKNPSLFEARSLSGDVGAEVVLELGLPAAS